jgi:non-specific serine/threonine protein kinase
MYRFAGFELRPHERTLTADGKPATVGPRAFDLLVALVERSGSLVSKDELLTRVWPNLVVEENNLQVQVSTLRKILGPDAIATVAGHGYRFTIPVQASEQRSAARQAEVRGPPLPATKFVGRDAELREVRDLLDEARLLSLVGVGGIGKTRLAIELAAACKEQYPDGVAYVELAAVEDPRSIVDVVASTLDVVRDPSRSTIEVLMQHVATRSLLIVLDNCEHLLQPCAQLASQLLRSSAGLKIVSTTREALHVVSEVVYHVPTMAVPESVALFVDRASSVDRKFAMTSDNAEHVSRICRELDGIPLALELAASRVRAMSVKTIAEHLGERLRLLVGGDRSGLPRQQTLRAMIDWSYQLLNEAERALLRRMAVFSGGFELDAAQAVGAANDVRKEDVLYLLANLVEKSLVEFDANRNRYRLLETVRQYGVERLTEHGEESEARDQHLAFYASLSEYMLPIIRTSAQPALTARAYSERDNIVSAFAHTHVAPDGGTAGLKMVQPLLMALQGMYLDLSSRLANEAVTHPGAQARDVFRAHALQIAGWLEFWQGRYDMAFAKVDESVAIAREIGDARTLAEALYRFGCIHAALERYDEAKACFEEQLELARAIDDRYIMSDAHSSLGELYSVLGRFDLAEIHYLEALGLNPDEPESHVVGPGNLARNAIALGKEAEAVGYYRRALAGIGDAIHNGYIQMTLCTCAGIATMRRDWVCAIRLFAAADAHRQRVGYHYTEPDGSIFRRRLQIAREALGEPAASEVFAAGAAMSENDACQEAVAWIATVEP